MMQQFLAPFKKLGATEWSAVGLGLVLLVVYVYWGTPAVFAFRIVEGFGWQLDGDFILLSWLAQAYQFGVAAVCLGIVPLLMGVFVSGHRAAEMGIAIGDWRFGLKAVGGAALVLTPLLYLNSFSTAFQAEYPLLVQAGDSAGHFLAWQLLYLVYYVSWEFFFRGYWQLGLRSALGPFGAMALQTAASTLMHIGKPFGETLAAVAAGFGFGALALRTRSFLYPLLLHWYIGAMTDLFCLLNASSG
jgi:membrane protease YdiL (CAAX protease family)